MIDKSDMYNSDKDADIRAKTKNTNNPIKIENEGIIVESNGKKATVVSKAEHDRVKKELEDAKKEVRMLKTQVQKMEKFLTKFSKEVSGKLNEHENRFNRY